MKNIDYLRKLVEQNDGALVNLLECMIRTHECKECEFGCEEGWPDCNMCIRYWLQKDE